MNNPALIEQEPAEMEKIIKEFFQIVPGMANAKNVPVVNADSLSKEAFIEKMGKQ